jgi:crotonobetainyl-CoA:carnitine CoA-transferase CaiB-like acyl-CoA transferase
MLLEGLKVVELSTWVAAAACTSVMADWGAEVIKVEPPSGDGLRRMYPDTAESPGNPVFSMENRGKQGVVLDASKPDGRSALFALLRQADILLTNVRPAALKRARLDYDSLKDEFPRLIYANITGYGLSGELADTVAFDTTAFWARTGAASATIPPDQEPFGIRPGFGDHMAAMTILSGILAALHERAGTGRGRHLETSLLRVGAYAMGWDLSLQLRYGAVVTAQPRDDQMVALTGFFRTRDNRHFVVVTRGDADDPRKTLLAVGRGDLADDPRNLPPFQDIEDVRRIRSVLDEAFGKLTLKEAGELLSSIDVAWAPMERLEDLETNPQAHEAGCFVSTDDGWGGSFLAPASPVNFVGLNTSPRGPAPKLGQHTRLVLGELGYSATQIDAMIAAGAADVYGA